MTSPARSQRPASAFVFDLVSGTSGAGRSLWRPGLFLERGEIRIDIEGAVDPVVDQVASALLGEEHQVGPARPVRLELDDRGDATVGEDLDEGDGEDRVPLVGRGG